MSISVQAGVLAFRRVANYAQGASPAVQIQLKALKTWLTEHKGSPDLEFVPFDELSSTDVVVADAACTLYALVLIKDTATASYSKLTNHASTGSDDSSDLVVLQNAIGSAVLFWNEGLALDTGATLQGTTTASGGTGSSSNGAKGFALIGAA